MRNDDWRHWLDNRTEPILRIQRKVYQSAGRRIASYQHHSSGAAAQSTEVSSLHNFVFSCSFSLESKTYERTSHHRVNVYLLTVFFMLADFTSVSKHKENNTFRSYYLDRLEFILPRLELQTRRITEKRTRPRLEFSKRSPQQEGSRQAGHEQ